MQQRLDYIHSLTDFSEQGWQILLPVLTRMERKKATHLLQEGDVYNSEVACRGISRKQVY
jgi:hypothetical protein